MAEGMWRMFRAAIARACLSAIVVLTATRVATAHGIVGDRMFIEPIATEDANVKNELVLPNGQFLRSADGARRAFGISLEKSLYPNRVSVIVETARIVSADAGWDNLEIGLKWEAYINEHHEFALSPTLFAQLPTGSENVTERQAAVRPMLLLAKGFGDVSRSWARPFAIQADLGYERPAHGADRTVNYDAVLMYSFPYLNDFVRFANQDYELEESLRRGLSWGALWGNLHPFIEMNAQTDIGDAEHTGTVLRSGAAWMGKYIQVTIAADQRREAGLSHWGATVLFDWFLDEFFPRLASGKDARQPAALNYRRGVAERSHR